MATNASPAQQQSPCGQGTAGLSVEDPGADGAGASQQACRAKEANRLIIFLAGYLDMTLCD
jgi:hypothetical protein